MRLVLNITIQMLKDDMKINDYFYDDELEEIIVGLCNKKNIEITRFFQQDIIIMKVVRQNY